MIDSFEAGDTIQFTFVSSVAPDAWPSFAVYGPNDNSTLVASQTSIQSASTAFYALFTTPLSNDGRYYGLWYATKTLAGNPYPFRKWVTFNVAQTGRRN